MILYSAVTFLLIFHIAKCEVTDEATCEDVYKNMDDHPITDINVYCHNKLCLTKCCGDGKILDYFGNKCFVPNAKLLPKINYYNISSYSWRKSQISRKKFSNFTLVQNERFIRSNNCYYERSQDAYHILEDGSAKVKITTCTKDNGHGQPWYEADKLTFCVEYRIVAVHKGNITKRNVAVVLRVILDNTSKTDNERKSTFTVIAMLTSCIFMVLVLVVYALLRQLRNMSGLMLMAYVWSLLVTYVIKVSMVLAKEKLNDTSCKIISPVFYYAALSSFFWLNVISFDIWWTLRGHQMCRQIHRQGELVKFLWYCLYGWGTPLLITAIVVVLDNVDPESLPFLKPAFRQCFTNGRVVTEYIYKPIGIIIASNIVFFMMTAYNIWLIKKRVYNDTESRRSNNDTNRFLVYLKLSVVMGLCWCLELLPDVQLGWSILINFNNVLVGVVIFFLFVFKKKIYIMLCKRFLVYLKLSVVMGLCWCLELLPDVQLGWSILINFNNVLVGVVIFFLFVFKKKIYIMLCKRFLVYLKLSVVMGLCWCLELLPDVQLGWSILINFNNVLVGVVIFFLFVFKKKIYIMLCKRFGIQTKYMRNLENKRLENLSGTTRTSDMRSNSTKICKPLVQEKQF